MLPVWVVPKSWTDPYSVHTCLANCTCMSLEVILDSCMMVCSYTGARTASAFLDFINAEVKADSTFARIEDLDVLARKYVGSGSCSTNCVLCIYRHAQSLCIGCSQSLCVQAPKKLPSLWFRLLVTTS